MLTPRETAFLHSSLRRLLLRVLSVLVALFLLYYLLYHATNGFQGRLETYNAEYATAERTLTATGYLFRAEQLLTAATAGTILYEGADMEKVAAGAPVATVFPGSATEETIDRLQRLKSRISLLREAGARPYLLQSKAVTEAAIDAALLRFYALLHEGRLEEALAIGNALHLQLSRLALQEAQQSDYHARIAELEAQSDNLVAALSLPSERIFAPTDGNFTPSYDGWESLFSYEEVGTLTAARLEELAACMETSSPALHPQTVGKLITESTWYVAATLPIESATLLTVGQNYDVTFSLHTTPLSLRLERADADETGRALLLFSSATLPAGFSYDRCQTLTIPYEQISGLCIPAQGMHYEDGQTFVYILYGNRVMRRAADPIACMHGYYYIDTETAPQPAGDETYSPLRAHEPVIVAGTNLYHKKVYQK